MNCKPNDLAIVVRTSVGGLTIPAELLGASVTVVEDHETKIGPVWIIKEPILWTPKVDCITQDGIAFAGHTYWIVVLPDAMLQPMRGRRDGIGEGASAPILTSGEPA